MVQGPYPFHHDRADVVLPSTVFAEESGSVVSGEGFVHSLNKAARPPALARPDWEILAMLGKTMHSPAFDYDGLEKLQRELMKQTKLKPGSLWRPAGRKKPALLLPELDSLGSAAEPSGPQFPAFSYRGASLEAEITDFASLAAGLRRRWSDE